MLESKILMFAVGLAAAATIASPTIASAQKVQKKISYEEAFKRCKAFMDKETGGFANSTTNELNRTRRGAACMQKFGYKL